MALHWRATIKYVIITWGFSLEISSIMCLPIFITCIYLNITPDGTPTNLHVDKCKPLASSIPNLWCVSSVDSIKKAAQLDAGRALLEPKPTSLLNIHVQVNTSGEESKSGCQPGHETLEVCRHIKENCEQLKLLGLMTSAAIARSNATTPENENEDFLTLKKERDEVSKELGIELELSMGMSEDFEGAILQGSDEVRVGSTIFGERPAKGRFQGEG
jgi:pyridoxal phosphate enzyme (YggS family)